MRELGRKGGKGRSGIKSERVHESLHAYLKREVTPAEVWAALKMAMEGQNESARVAASRVLMDALAEPAGVEGNSAAERKRVAEEARAHLDAWLPKVCFAVVDRLLKCDGPRVTDPMIVNEVIALVEKELQAKIDELGVELSDFRSVILYDIGPEKAARTFEELERVGLLVPRGKVEERAEQIAQERLAALKASTG